MYDIYDITDGVVTLKPFTENDYEYLYRLGSSNEHTKMSYDKIKESFEDISGVFWVGYVNDKLKGVTYLAYHKLSGIWSLDGYQDGCGAFYGYRAGKLAMGHFFNYLGNTLHIICPVSNRPARMLGSKLGFKVAESISCDGHDYWLMRKTKETQWAR